MNSILKTDFSVNKENNTITVKRDFAAPVNHVWAAWTKSELLDQWWAPRPYKAVTKSIDFKTGGHWFYAMEGPEGDRMWIIVQIDAVEAEKSFAARTHFSDENRKINNEMPEMVWNASFSGNNETATVDILFTFDSFNDLETTIAMGFKDGFTACLEQLDQLISTKQ